MHANKPLSPSIKGFTLIELVIGIIVFAIALTLFTSLIVPQAVRSVDPIFQVRAAELANSLISEIASKPFDENSSRVGGTARCNEVGNPCTSSGTIELFAEEGSANRDIFDDVDDYHGLDASDGNIENSLNEAITIGTTNLYNGFRAQVSVVYDDNMDGVDDAIAGGAGYIGNTKLITVTITTPNSEDIIFSTYRSNF